TGTEIPGRLRRPLGEGNPSRPSGQRFLVSRSAGPGCDRHLPLWSVAMGTVLAIDAGTTGVRSLAVDEQGKVVDVAYRELTQHFPRPGWVEHDAGEIWGTGRATLDEVAGRLADHRREA